MAFQFPMLSKTKRKVPPTYSRADDSARSLTARRDDEYIEEKPEQYPLLHKDRLRHHDVHALIAVDQLGDVHVAGDAGEHIGVVTA